MFVGVQVPVGVYPEGVVKYKCASRGYTAWWQRKLYFTFLTAYILVIPAVFMTYCYVNVVIVVWKRSRELSAFKTPPAIHVDQTGNDVIAGSGRGNLPVGSSSDVGGRNRFFRFRSATTGSERGADIELRSRAPHADDGFETGTGNRLSTETGNAFSRLPRRRLHLFRRAATESECGTSRPVDAANEFETGTGNTFSNLPGRRHFRPPLRRAATESERASQTPREAADEFGTGTGSTLSTGTGRVFSERRFRPLRRAATDASPREAVAEFETGTGNRSTSPMTSPARLRRAAFNAAAMSRARVRTVQMTLCIVCSFIACWTPYFAVHLVHIWSEYRYHIPESVYVVAETLALVNSAVNPLLYACFNASMSCRRRRRGPGRRPTDLLPTASEFDSAVSRA